MCAKYVLENQHLPRFRLIWSSAEWRRIACVWIEFTLVMMSVIEYILMLVYISFSQDIHSFHIIHDGFAFYLTIHFLSLSSDSLCFSFRGRPRWSSASSRLIFIPRISSFPPPSLSFSFSLFSTRGIAPLFYPLCLLFESANYWSRLVPLSPPPIALTCGVKLIDSSFTFAPEQPISISKYLLPSLTSLPVLKPLNS